MRRIPILAASLSLASLGVAQTVWNVPPGGAIQPVVDGAAPGDIVQLAPGNYDKFALTKGLTIVGPATLGGTTTALDLTIDVPAGENARLVGLAVQPNPQPTLFPVGTTFVTGGVVVFEGCSFTSTPNASHAVSVDSAHVVFDHCVLDGDGGASFSGVALRMVDSDVTATDSSFLAPAGVFFTGPGRGIEASGAGSLQLSHCNVTGGDAGGIIAEAPPQPAIVTGVPTWITDSTVLGGGNGFFQGAVGIFATASTEVARSTVQGGTGVVAPGAPTSGPVTANPDLLGARSTDPTSVGGIFTITFVADQPGTAVVVLATVSPLIVPITNPVLAQPLWATPVFDAALLTTGLAGEASLSVNVPADPTLQYQAFDFVGATIASSQVQFAPVVPVTLR